MGPLTLNCDHSPVCPWGGKVPFNISEAGRPEEGPGHSQGDTLGNQVVTQASGQEFHPL